MTAAQGTARRIEGRPPHRGCGFRRATVGAVAAHRWHDGRRNFLRGRRWRPPSVGNLNGVGIRRRGNVRCACDSDRRLAVGRWRRPLNGGERPAFWQPWRRLRRDTRPRHQLEFHKLSRRCRGWSLTCRDLQHGVHLWRVEALLRQSVAAPAEHRIGGKGARRYRDLPGLARIAFPFVGFGGSRAGLLA